MKFKYLSLLEIFLAKIIDILKDVAFHDDNVRVLKHYLSSTYREKKERKRKREKKREGKAEKKQKENERKRISNEHTNSWQAYLESVTVMAQSMQRNYTFAAVNGAR